MDCRVGETIAKPWGSELIWAHTERYVGKVLRIHAGERLSLQRHDYKDESILVQSGTLRLHLGETQADVTTRELGPGEYVRVPTGWVHRFEAGADDVTLVEVSTCELDDVVRLSDDYGR
jgi:quercetin dioxygenase-like cupin family protein